MRVVFMGTPDFAAASLKAVIAAGYEIAGVFTQPDRPRDRGMKSSVSPVKAVAEAHGLPVYQPENLRDGSVPALMRRLAPDILVVVAYGRILPDALLAVPPMGAINVHGSMLPKYRGAAPIQWAVLNGDSVTGVTTMYLAHDMDAGDIIYTNETPIGEFETSGALFERLSDMGARLLIRTLRDIEAGTAPRIKQDETQATYVRQLGKSISPIDWNRTPREIVKHICGLDPWPVATMTLGGAAVRVFGAEYTDTITDRPPGTIMSAGKRGIEVVCGSGATLLITELQPPGKKRMKASDYLLGHPVEVD
ncbi:MAG TPA: methionyl-tRNA formyltransferase [Clostridiales bacterium]|nr:methionyl-tRNA formyltransferase [Clostridiales bacterium]